MRFDMIKIWIRIRKDMTQYTLIIKIRGTYKKDKKKKYSNNCNGNI